MKKILLILFAAAFINTANAQFTGKPIYTIRVERSDTFLGNIIVEMFPEIAFNHVLNWDSLVNNNLYDSTAFHRIISGFMIQGGDPNSVNGPESTWGQGNSSQVTVDAEFSEVPHKRGILSAARGTNINSASSQFFICHANAFSLDGNYSVYGQTISGIDVVDLIVTAPKNSNDLPNDKITMFITRTGSNDSVPIAPLLNLPLNLETGIYPSTLFKWSAIGDAKLYRFEIATDSLFNFIVYTKNTKNTSSYAAGLSNVTEYYWRVRANNGGHLSLVDEVRKFTSGVGETELIYPENLDETENVVLFEWKDIPQASGYHIMVSKVANFFNPSYTVLDEIVQNNEYFMLDYLEVGVVYYWKVATIDAQGGESAFTTVNAFKPAFYYDGIERLNASIVSVYPNPFDDKLLINSTQSDVLIIYNLLGEVIFTQIIIKGDNEIDVTKLRKGIYFYSIEKGNHKGKLVKK